MPKRKRTPEEDEGSQSNSSFGINEGRPKRRRNDTTLVDTIQYIFDALRNKKKDDDTYLCETFLRAPKKKTEPQYYEVVKKPIDMLKIQQKTKTDIYNEFEEFCSDVELLVENAKLYYAKSTEEYKDACELWKIFIIAKEKAPEEVNKEKLRQQQNQESEDEFGKCRRRGRPSRSTLASSAPMILEEGGSPMTMQEAIEEHFGAIVTASDDEGRIFSYDFQLLPAPEKYPKYYQVIQQPIDLKTIALHIQDKHYENLDSLERDMNLMFDNACTFNEPGSRIYKDARTLRNLTQIRKQDLVHVLNAKKSVRLRSKRAPDDKKWSELVANLQEGERLPLPVEDGQLDLSVSMTTHEDDESDGDVDQDNPMWQLFLAAKNLSAPNDPNYLLCEPFRRLPNRRWHSDYYQEIKNPISMSQIRKKILKGEYHYISEMVEDFNLMLDNAQQYNRPDSRIFRDAAKLQKFIQTKAEELSVVEEEVDSDSDTDDTDSQMGFRKKPPQSRPWTFKRRAKLLFKTLMDFMTDDGRQPIVAFIEKPSKKDYPDYYLIINDPIDMEMIEAKIKTDQYTTDEELISDFRLMFKNCQAYNEEGSQIYQDANVLEKVLNEKLGELQFGGDVTMGKGKCTKKNKYSHYMNMTKNIKVLYISIREYKDKNGRQLSDVFLKLPSKQLYPDYYEVIKQPIDLERIINKWKSGCYSSMDDILTDLTLMFQNACIYNDPESQIYRDALTLQRLALQKRLELSSREDSVPNIVGLVQEMLMSLFISVFNHENDEGVYTSISFSELPDYEEVDGQKSRALNFDIMKRRLDKCLYTRLDQFQDDLFFIFDRARDMSKSNSIIYTISLILQREYMKIRDELCGNGTVLKSRALNFKEEHLNAIISKASKSEPAVAKGDSTLLEDTNDGITEDEDSKASNQPSDEANKNFASHNEVQYYVGDFVYLSPPEKNCDYQILHIQRLWTNTTGQQMLYGCQYYRPAETFHLPNRKFYDQEVFKTDKLTGLPLSEVLGKCVVLSAIDYPKLKVDNFDEKDVYICESRYSTKNRFFKKIKVWPFSLPQGVKITEREEPIEPKRVGSVFKERIDKHKEELAELEEETKLVRAPLPNILKSQDSDAKGNTFYQQYNVALGPLKLGDFVYVRNGGVKAIRHIVRIWVSPEGNSYMSGTRYVRAQDVSVVGDRKPYKQEVYLTSQQETLLLSDVIGRCCVLHIKDYLTQRPTEIHEKDIFLCEKFFDEMNQRIGPLQAGILKFSLPPEVYPDEIYYFWRPLNPQKFETSLPAPVKKPKVDLVEPETEDSMDGRPASVASADSSLPATPKPVKKPSSKMSHQMAARRQMTGYILFSIEIRKSVTQRNPEANFGEISRLIGIEWKRLTESERKAFEDRAHQMNIESAEKAQALLLDSPITTTPQVGGISKGASELPLPNNPDVVYECLWESCDFMFEDLADLFDHLLSDANGHVHRVHTVFECSWRGCSRHKKSSLAPFPMIQRLVRHVREVHVVKNTGRYVQHQDRSRNFIPSSRRSLLNDSAPATLAQVPNVANNKGLNVGRENQYQITFGAPIQVNGHISAAGVNGVTAKKPGDPLFVNPPPKTQRLLHSEAYIKYIENLDKPFISNWERQLTVTAESAIISDTGRLPAHWLANGAGNHGTVINALWALREYMMKDSLGIAKIL